MFLIALVFILVLILIFVLLIYTSDFNVSITDFPLAFALTLALFMFFIIPHLPESTQNDLHYDVVGEQQREIDEMPDSQYIKSRGFAERKDIF
jgi:hypothetical protein